MMEKNKLKIFLASPRGFCAGVERAIEIVERALEIYGPPIYVRHEIVHNKHVVDRLRQKGVIFVEGVSEVPDGSVLILSAHGVSNAVQAAVAARPPASDRCDLSTGDQSTPGSEKTGPGWLRYPTDWPWRAC